jgi:hypothetical protein
MKIKPISTFRNPQIAEQFFETRNRQVSELSGTGTQPGEQIYESEPINMVLVSSDSSNGAKSDLRHRNFVSGIYHR